MNFAAIVKSGQSFLAVFFLSFRLGGTLDAPTLKPSEVFLGLAFIACCIDIARRRFVLPPDQTRSLKKYSFGPGCFFLNAHDRNCRKFFYIQSASDKVRFP